MGLNDVRQRIVEEAEKKAALLVRDAAAEGQKITADAQREVKEHEKELRAHSEKMLSALERKELAAAEYEGKKVLLDKKRGIIDQVMSEATQELRRMPSHEREQMLTLLLKQARSDLDVKTVYVNKQDKTCIKEKGITVKENAIIGGLIAETADGRMSVDLSFEELLAQIRETYLRELSEVLFGG